MNQGRDLHRVAGAFPAHIAAGQLAQFRIDQVKTPFLEAVSQDSGEMALTFIFRIL